MTDNKQQNTYTMNAFDALNALLTAQADAEKAKADAKKAKEEEPFNIMTCRFGKQTAPWGLVWAFQNDFGHFIRLVVDTKSCSENLLEKTTGLKAWNKDNAKCRCILLE